MSVVPATQVPEVSKAVSSADPLTDGSYLAFLHSVNLPTMTIVVDVAQWWSGPEGVKAAIAHGYIKPGQTLPNDYFISNDSPLLRTLRIAPTVTVTVARCPTSCATYAGTVRGLADAFAHPNPKADLAAAYRTYNPYWLKIINGEVVRIDEQYLP